MYGAIRLARFWCKENRFKFTHAKAKKSFKLLAENVSLSWPGASHVKATPNILPSNNTKAQCDPLFPQSSPG